MRPNNFRSYYRRTAQTPELNLNFDLSEASKKLEELSIVPTSPGFSEWPRSLNQLNDPPVLLYRQGLPITSSPVLGIVGSRSECGYAKRIARKLVKKWQDANPKGRIVSGGGLGVDAAAWQAALDFGVAPIMVLAHGLGRPHLSTLRGLYERTKSQGTLLSEALPLSTPLPAMFPDRNRLIAALADTLVVVRGAKRSGSLHTLNSAVKLGKPVFGVVGPIDDPGWFGIHDAIKIKKVRPLFDLDDLCPNDKPRTPSSDALNPTEAPPQEAQILEALNKKQLAIEELASILGLTAASTMRLVLPLEIRGWIHRTSDGRFQISQ